MDHQFYLAVFGGLALRGRDGSLESRVGKRRLVLLATLAAAGDRGVPRDLLGALFWPDSDDARARGALKQAVYALRTELGPDAIPATSTGYALSPTDIGSDLHDFRVALEAGELELAVTSYAGPFLAGVHVEGAAELEHWTEKTRAELEADYRKALLTLLTGPQRDATEKRVGWAQRLLELDRGDARAAELLVRALSDAGRSGHARRAVQEYERWVRDELGGAPDPTVAAALTSASEAMAAAPRRDEGPVIASSVRAPGAESPPAASEANVAAAAAAAAAPARRRRRVSRAALAGALGLAALGAFLVQSPWRRPEPRVMDLRHVAKSPVYLRVTTLGGDASLAAPSTVFREALASAIPKVPAFLGVFRAPEDSVRLAQLPGRDTMVAPFDVNAQLSLVSDSVMVFLQAENRANPAIATTATLALGTRADPLSHLEDVVDRLVGALALRTDTDSLKTIVYQPPPRYESYRRWKAGFELFHGDWDPGRMLPLFLSAYQADSAWLTPVYYAVRVYDAVEEFDHTDRLLADALRRVASNPTLEAELEALARTRALSRASIGSASLPPAQVLLSQQPGATSAQFYEKAREYYTAGRPAEATLLLSRIDTAGGVLSTTDGSSYWLRNLALHSAGDYEREMALAELRFERSVTGISNVEWIDYMRAMAATGRSSRLLARFDSLPSDIVERDQYIGWGYQLGGEVAFHGDSVVARQIFDRISQTCALRGAALVHYRHYCPMVDIARGDTVAARVWVERLSREDIDPLTLLGLRGLLAAAAGRRVEVHATLKRIAGYRDNLHQGRADFWRARILGLTGDREGAIAALAEAKENGWFPFWGMHGYFHFYPELISLKDDPRVRSYWIVGPRG